MPRQCVIIPPESSPFGTTTFLCGTGLAKDRCKACHTYLAEFACDYPTGRRGATCSTPICRNCRVRTQGDPADDDDPLAKDYCPAHAPLPQDRPDLYPAMAGLEPRR